MNKKAICIVILSISDKNTVNGLWSYLNLFRLRNRNLSQTPPHFEIIQVRHSAFLFLIGSLLCLSVGYSI